MGDLTPITREEYYLARMAGEDVTMPEPITREEEYMKGIAAQIEAGSAELPAVTDEDEGKILAVNASGKWDKTDAPTELPIVTASDNGDILAVVDGEWAKADAPSGLTPDLNGEIDVDIKSKKTTIMELDQTFLGKTYLVILETEGWGAATLIWNTGSFAAPGIVTSISQWGEFSNVTFSTSLQEETPAMTKLEAVSDMLYHRAYNYRLYRL